MLLNSSTRGDETGSKAYPKNADPTNADAAAIASGRIPPSPVFLLVAPEPAASTLLDALRGRLCAEVVIVPPRRSSILSLQREDFSLALLDENLAAAFPDATEALYLRAGAAPVLEINFAICEIDRVLRQIRSALGRRAHDEAKARTAAAAALHNDLNASLAGLLLESQLARQKSTPELAPALERIVQMASALRNQLRA